MEHTICGTIWALGKNRRKAAGTAFISNSEWRLDARSELQDSSREDDGCWRSRTGTNERASSPGTNSGARLVSSGALGLRWSGRESHADRPKRHACAAREANIFGAVQTDIVS